MRITLSYSWLRRISPFDWERVRERERVAEVEREQERGDRAERERERDRSALLVRHSRSQFQSGREKTERTGKREVCRMCVLLARSLSLSLYSNPCAIYFHATGVCATLHSDRSTLLTRTHMEHKSIAKKAANTAHLLKCGISIISKGWCEGQCHLLLQFTEHSH